MMFPKAFNIRDHFTKRSIPENAANVYHTTQYDNDIAPSIEDRRFIEIVGKGIYKNDPGNWEMRLPFSYRKVSIPSKRGYALRRFNGQLRTHNANHKWSKMLDNGPAVSVPEREICFRKTLDECGTHLISEFTIQKKTRPDSSHIQPFRSVPREVSQPCIPHWPPNKQSCWSLICFRHGDVASTCDVEQMLYSFHISTRFYVSWPPCMLLETKGQNLAHELLVIWMSEVSAIVSAHSITTIPSDSDEPLAPIDTLHVANSEDPPVRSSPRKNASQNLYAHQADQFWSRSRGEYLQNLQVRTKYNWERRNLVAGEMVTLKDKQTHRNN